jgi:hypothetical protein
LQNGLPPAPVTWAVVQKEFHDLVLSTYGRGLYILDDITPLEQMARHRSESAVVFFEPRKTYRFVPGGTAMLNYSLTSAPKNEVQLEILDSVGNTVRKLEEKAVVGVNRFKWDLRYESPRVVALRTVAPDNPRIWQEPRFRETESRPITHWGSKPAEIGPIVAPGTYSVRLKVDGQSLAQTLVVVSDPRSPGSEADIQLSVKTLLVIRDHISHVSDSINQMEWLRKQLEVIQTMLRPAKPAEKSPAPEIVEEGDEPDVEPPPAPPRVLSEVEEQQRAQLLAAAEDLDHKLQTVETRLVSRALRNSDDKYFVEANGVYLDLIWLNAEVGTGGGDVAGGADFAPTQAQLESLKSLEDEMAQVDAAFTEIVQRDLPAFNQTLEHANLTPLMVLSKRSRPKPAGPAGPVHE